MKKIFILFIISVFSWNMCAFANAENPTNGNSCRVTIQKTKEKNTLVKNRLFSIALPAKLKSFYQVKKAKNNIFVYHKESKKAGFGGFAFGIEAYKNPADHAEMPGSIKIGELTDKKGVLYDIVLQRPTDVQYDYKKYPETPESYKLLYNLGDVVVIKGVKGSTYFKNQGMKGEDLYGDILKKHITAIKEKWDSAKLEKENMSYMYNVVNVSGKKAGDVIGYIYSDVNGDGIDELLIGEIADGNQKGMIYDIYTMVNRKPEHVVSGGSRNRYFVCENGFICNEYSSGAKESGLRTYFLTENSTELYPQVSFKYDGYAKTKSPYFLTYGNPADENKWENVSEKRFYERRKSFEKYKRFDFIPLSKFSEVK